MATPAHGGASLPERPTGEADMLGNLLANLEGLVYRCLLDENWTMEFLSEGCKALTGYTREELIDNGRLSFEDIIHPEDRRRVREAVNAALKENRRFNLEYRIIRSDGALRWVWERGVGLHDASGNCFALEGFIQDITQRKQSEEALYEAERRFRSLFENAVEGIFQSSPTKDYLMVNPALAHMYGYESPEQMLDHLRHSAQRHYTDPNRLDEFLCLMAERDSVINFESQAFKRDGSLIWISENVRAVRGANSEILFLEGTVIDITERKLHEEKIRHQATHDALTGLPNRSLLYDRLQQVLQNARRNGETAAVAFIDLDQFKFINDSLGHQVGDELLRVISERLLSCMRDSDTVARQGGDEFVIVLGGQTSLKSISDAMQRILAVVAQPWTTVNGLELHVTCSVGVSVYPHDGTDAETLLRHADAAMYKAKELGRNDVQYFAAEMRLQAAEHLEMLNSLRHAVARGELLLHYQPKVDLETGAIVGAEALLRWRNDTRGVIPPEHFIPLAEESGLILTIGAWALRTACAQNVEWQREGRTPISISINLSPRQLARNDIVEVVAEVLASTGLEPAYLELEITETVVMRDVEKSMATLMRLKELGVKIAIDDFGTGYSSLNYLKRFPVDTLKIDRSFVNDIATDQGDAAIVKAVISLAHILNLNVVAEGVETEDQCGFLLENGCDEGQGYYIGKPMSHDEFMRLCL